ncbi:MAG: hypothetical protein WCG87_12310 [Bacteroidota bacterium]
MKFWKHTLVTSFAFFCLCSTVLYTACAPKDSCADLKCINGGACSDNFCHCPSAFDGPQCENKIADRFIGTFIGDMSTDGFPTISDTIHVFMQTDPDYVGISYSHSTGISSVVRDTVYGTVRTVSINFNPITNGNYSKSISANINNQYNRLVISITENPDVTTSSSTLTHSSFIGFKQ